MVSILSKFGKPAVIAAFLFLGLCSPAAGWAGTKATAACVSIAEATRQANRELCVNAHIYSVVELPDGTRFLDVCPLDVSDDDCRFLILSLREDREEVGPLGRYNDADVKIRGVVRPMHGRVGIVLSHIRQFSGGPEKFKPNPKLLRGFNAQSSRMPVRDPNLSPNGRQRSFMNNEEKETLPAAKRP
jgi:hypothetical protein